MKRWQKYLIFTILAGNLLFRTLRGCKDWLETGAHNVTTGKVASLSLASDEILVDIMRESGELEEILALSSLADNPDYSFLDAEVTSLIKERSDTNLERLIALGPSLVITASFNRLSLVNILKSSGMRVLKLPRFNSLSDLYNNYRLVGKALHREQETERVLHQLDKSLGKLRNTLDTPWKTLIWLQDGTVLGSHTLLHDILTLVGGENVAGHELTAWSKPNLEVLSSYPAEVILTVCEENEKPELLSLVKSHPTLSLTEAVTKARVVCLTKKEFSAQSAHILKTAHKLHQRLHEFSRKKST